MKYEKLTELNGSKLPEFAKIEVMNIVPEKNHYTTTPKNRIVNPHLGVIEIEILGSEKLYKLDPNSVIIYALNGFEGIGKGFTHLDPDISSRPANEEVYVYRTNCLTLHLTKGQLMRLAMLNLTAMEYFQLVEKFGIEHEWHEDFYHPETGEAFQPIGQE